MVHVNRFVNIFFSRSNCSGTGYLSGLVLAFNRYHLRWFRSPKYLIVIVYLILFRLLNSMVAVILLLLLDVQLFLKMSEICCIYRLPILLLLCIILLIHAANMGIE